MRRRARLLFLFTLYSSLFTGLTGCESFERKFIRKSKRHEPAPDPVINFQDYTQAMTPIDRYRKHYLIFDYWNDELIEELQSSSPNPKLLKRASAESLEELKALQGLVTDDVAARMGPFIDDRITLQQRFESGSFPLPQAHSLLRELEAQERQIHRDFFWRDVEDQLKQ